MLRFAPLTPELRARLAPGASREFLRRIEARAGLAEATIEAVMATAPNEKALGRAARRLRGKPGVVEVVRWRDGSTHCLSVVDRYATGVDRARPDASGDSVRLFETAALAFRTTLFSFRRRWQPMRDAYTTTYFDRHAISRRIERSAIHPGRVSDDQLCGILARAHRGIRGSLSQVERATLSGRLAEELAATFAAPCGGTGGLWIVERSDAGTGSWDATVVTYLGADQLDGDQNAFVTACGDGDFIGALRDYPEAIRRVRTTAAAEARLGQITAGVTPGFPEGDAPGA
jgi:hypothetical protein